MKKGILAIIIYNVIFWGILSFFCLVLRHYRDEIMIFYAIIMPVVFYIVYNMIFCAEKTGIGQYLSQILIRVVITIVFTIIMHEILSIDTSHKDWFSMDRDIWLVDASGILSTISFVVVTIICSFVDIFQ